MEPVNFEGANAVYGANQPEYIPLPAEVREASVRNIELRLFLRDLYRSGGVLRLPAVDNDMPKYL